MTKFNEKLLQQRMTLHLKMDNGYAYTFEVAHEKTVLGERQKTKEGKDINDIFIVGETEIINTGKNWSQIIQALKERYEAINEGR